MGDAKLVYNVEEAADALGVSPSYVRKLISAGDILSVKMGRRRMIALVDLQNYITAKRAEGSHEQH